jgi:succinoglycan biosynthesis transport protein ExoP
VSFAAFAMFGWILSSAPRYTADTLILIDNKRVRAVEDAHDITASDAPGSVVDSQVEVVRSENVATSVVRKLDLISALKSLCPVIFC